MPITTEVRVRYAETDQMGIVYYANYLVWFEIGRVEVLRALGLSYRQLEAEHQCILPVAEARCRYRSPARYDDRILIEARPALLRGSLIKFAYRIFRLAPDEKERQLLAEGETTHVVCDGQLNRKHLPAEFAAALKAMMESRAIA
jgi:acyl-CoA thioester hydrolase